MKGGKLKNGFEFEVDENVLDDMRLIDAMAEAQEDNPTKFSKAILMVLGEDQRNRLYEHIALEDGRVPIGSISEAFVEIFEAMGEEGKN